MSIKDKIASLSIGEYIGMKLSGGADSSFYIMPYVNISKDNNLDTKIIVVTLDTDFKICILQEQTRYRYCKRFHWNRTYEHFTVTVPHSDENYTNGLAELVAKAKENMET